jgi:hypothetical protein
MASAKCILVPLMLNAIFLVYANFKILGFKYQHLTFILYCNMFCMIHMNMNVSLCLHFLFKKKCKGFDGCLFCIKYHLQWLFVHCIMYLVNYGLLKSPKLTIDYLEINFHLGATKWCNNKILIIFYLIKWSNKQMLMMFCLKLDPNH